MVRPLPEQYKWSMCTNWIKAISGVLVLWSCTAWGATLTWNANGESDLAGYRVYQCSQLPCTRASGNASSLATVGTVTSFNIGTPAVTRYYFITAYDFANNESVESGLIAFTPAGSPPPVVPPAIGTSPTSLSFTATQGGANPATQTLSISNQGGGTLTWSATENTVWLAVSPSSGTGNGAVTVTVTTGSLTAGTYNSTVTMNASGASSVAVPVTFTIATAPVPPAIGASPTSLSFVVTQGGGNPATQTLSISNTGGGSLTWSASDNVDWLTLSPTTGTGNGVMTATVVTGARTAGTYNASITLNAMGASLLTVPVTLTVSTSPPPPPPPTPTAPPTPSGLRITQ
jgi:Viral BACON domain